MIRRRPTPPAHPYSRRKLLDWTASKSGRYPGLGAPTNRSTPRSSKRARGLSNTWPTTCTDGAQPVAAIPSFFDLTGFRRSSSALVQTDAGPTGAPRPRHWFETPSATVHSRFYTPSSRALTDDFSYRVDDSRAGDARHRPVLGGSIDRSVHSGANGVPAQDRWRVCGRTVSKSGIPRPTTAVLTSSSVRNRRSSRTSSEASARRIHNEYEDAADANRGVTRSGRIRIVRSARDGSGWMY